jgi:LuxR family transcriptional regulator, quorum-sensing system regulator BjaR1
VNRTRFVYESIEKLSRTNTPSELMGLLRLVGDQYGLGKSTAIGSIPGGNQDFARYQYADRWPAGWHERYMARGYFDRDPVIRKLRTAIRPFAWHEVRYDPQADKAAATVMNEATEFELRAGFNVPIRRGGQLATVTFGGDRFELGPNDRPLLQLIAVYAHDRIIELIGKRPIAPELRNPLTPREIEVLRWAAEGKTNQDIADILSISVNTAETHIGNVCRKLDALTRAHAAVRAIRLGLIP